jgi:hypothetical protein
MWTKPGIKDCVFVGAFLNVSVLHGVGAGISQAADSLRAGQTEFNSWQDRDFSLCHRVQTGTGAEPVCYSISPGSLSVVIRDQGMKLTSPHLSSAEVKNAKN